MKMTHETTNYIQFENTDIKTSNGVGYISTFDWDRKIEIEAIEASKQKNTTHRVWGRSPDGHRLVAGSIRLKENQNGEEYLCLSLPGFDGYFANLNVMPDQDDKRVQTIYRWFPQSD
jgi:uncharacterized protein (DUF736 family)